MITFALRHMLRHWRMNLVVLAALVISVAFLAWLPAYAVAIAGRGLRQQIDAAPISARNIIVSRDGLNAAIYGDIQALLGDMFIERMVVETLSSNIPGLGRLYRDEGSEHLFDEFLAFAPASIDGANARLTVIDGRLPTHQTPPPGQLHTEIEVVIGQTAAELGSLSRSEGANVESLYLQVGDQLRTPDEMLRINIVGIVAPSNPDSEIWWGDLSMFGFARESLNGPNQPDTVTYAMFVAPQTMTDALGGGSRVWRIIVDSARITVDNVAFVHANLSKAQTQLRVGFESGLLEIIDNYERQLDAAQVTLFLLTLQSLLFVLYTLGMIGALLLEQSRSAVAALAGRGFTSWQITRIFALQGLILSFILGLPLGLILARGVLRLWGTLTNTVVPSAMTNQSLLLALAAAVFNWLTLVVAIYFGMRGNILDWEQQRARPDTRAVWQKYYLDVFLLVVGGLIYWQLLDTGTVVAQIASTSSLADAGLADPLLLLGPSLLLIAVALLFLRFFPLFLRIVSWLAQNGRGLILPFGLAKLSRDPVGPSRVVLLISLAAGLTLFSSLFSYSLSTRQAEIAHYQTGADLRIGVPIQAGEEERQAVAALPGVEIVSPVYLNGRARLAANVGRQAQLLAIDPQTFPQVARFAPFISNITVPDVVPALTHRTATGAIPAVFSAQAYPLEKQIGEQIEYFVGTDKVTFEVRGIISNFPFVEGAFFISNLSLITEEVNLAALSQPWVGQRELWLEIDPAHHDRLVELIESGAGPLGSAITASALATEREFRANLVAQETLGAFGLNAFILIALSVGVFLMVHFFAARRRMFEFSLLRAAGISTRQLLGLLTLEGVVMMVLGLTAGTAVGATLAVIMRPFLSRTLSAALGGEALVRILVNWYQIGGLYTLLISFYALALLLLLFFFVRAGIHRALRIGDG